MEVYHAVQGFELLCPGYLQSVTVTSSPFFSFLQLSLVRHRHLCSVFPPIVFANSILQQYSIFSTKLDHSQTEFLYDSAVGREEFGFLPPPTSSLSHPNAMVPRIANAMMTLLRGLRLALGSCFTIIIPHA